MTLHILNVTLAHISPAIWRRLSVPSDCSLAQLHDAIQRAFGWENKRLHEFKVGNIRYGVPDQDGKDPRNEMDFTLAEVLPHKGARAEYIYDLGDNWIHEITVERLKEPTLSRPGRRPQPRRTAGEIACLAGARAAPPEDCGGPEAYEEFLRALSHPNHQRHAEMTDWSGGTFNPEDFNLAHINRRLAAL